MAQELLRAHRWETLTERAMDQASEASEIVPLPVADPLLEIPLAASSVRVPLRVRTVMLVAVIAPFFGLFAAIISLWGWGFRWSDLALLLAMYIATVLGVTVGFHRLFTHRAFETNRGIQLVFAVLGSMAVQGPL